MTKKAKHSTSAKPSANNLPHDMEENLPFASIGLSPLFYLLMTLDTTPEAPTKEDNRGFLADIVLFCARILHPEHDFSDAATMQLACESSLDFDASLLELAQIGAPFEGYNYGKNLFPNRTHDPEAMRLINSMSLLYFLQRSFEDRDDSAELSARLLLGLWGLLGEYDRQDILTDTQFIRYFDSAMRHTNARGRTRRNS